MSQLTRAAIDRALSQVQDPTTGLDLLSLNAVATVDIAPARIAVGIVLGYPAAGIQAELAAAVRAALQALAATEGAVAEVAVDISWKIGSQQASGANAAIPGVNNIVAVASGKGGVGKSTTTVNLALALAAEGARVGILDADIYGPSIPQMLGVAEQRPEVVDNRLMLPIAAHGLQSISMGYLITEETPMAWRGPMASGALQQLLLQTRWDKLDYLLIDMPPGTGDIQLTLAQKVPVAGAVIVTTPQDIALLDAKKGIEMFRKVNIPVLGVVENMATHICTRCGHEEHIFGAGGGARIASDYQTELLGALPLLLSIREGTDAGTPSVAADPASAIAQIYRAMARKLGARLWQGAGQPAAPLIEISDD